MVCQQLGNRFRWRPEPWETYRNARSEQLCARRSDPRLMNQAAQEMPLHLPLHSLQNQQASQHTCDALSRRTRRLLICCRMRLRFLAASFAMRSTMRENLPATRAGA